MRVAFCIDTREFAAKHLVEFTQIKQRQRRPPQHHQHSRESHTSSEFLARSKSSSTAVLWRVPNARAKNRSEAATPRGTLKIHATTSGRRRLPAAHCWKTPVRQTHTHTKRALNFASHVCVCHVRIGALASRHKADPHISNRSRMRCDDLNRLPSASLLLHLFAAC